MKNFLLFAGGVVTGVILTIIFAVVVYNASGIQDGNNSIKEDNDFTLFEEPGEALSEKSFKVFQVISNDAALANAQSAPDIDIYAGPVVLITNDEGKMYYDDEIINVKKNEIARQMGIYRYPTKNDMIKTVPIVKIMKK